MFHSLRFRLLLALLMVVMVAVGTVALFSSRVTAGAFERYVARDVERDQQVLTTLLTHYSQSPDLDRLQSLVAQLGRATGERIVLADMQGRVIADSDGQMLGQMLALPAPQPGGGAIEPRLPGDPIPGVQPSLVRASALGEPLPFSVYFNPPHRLATGPNEAGFLSSVNRSLVLAVLAATLAAPLLTITFSRRVLGPVEALTSAARQMARGDLSQRVAVRSQDEIGQLAHAFNAMADGLTRLDHLRRNMASDIAHELRTPLYNARGYLEALQDRLLQPTPELINSLHEEALLITRLVDDLQELARAEAGQLSLMRRPTMLQEVVDQAVRALSPAVSEKRLHVRVDLPPDLPRIDADPERIGQVLRNLLNNAVTHTPADGKITITARRLDGEIEVQVQDTGVGVEAEHVLYVFERFYRADRSRDRATGGSGLGLAIVRQLVEAHGGRVGAQSVVGEGASFTFTLPVAPETAGVEFVQSG